MNAIYLVTVGLLSALQACDFVGAVGLSGWYVDAGHTLGQTIAQKPATSTDIEKIRREFIELFGLPKRSHNGVYSSITRDSIPKFLIGIYKQLTEQDLNAIDNDDDMYYTPRQRYRRSSANDSDIISDANLRIIDESDTIMTFLHNNNVHPLNEQFNGTRLAFDLSEVSLDDGALLMAELHLHKTSIFRNSMNESESPCIITIFASKWTNG